MEREDCQTSTTTEARPFQAGQSAPSPAVQTSRHTADSQICPGQPVRLATKLAGNLPYATMILSGAAVFALALGWGPLGWLASVLYLAYGLAGALWIILFLCPYCRFYDTRLCPCGYGWVAARLRPFKDVERFAQQFRKHIAVIVPLWFIPVIVGAMGLYRHFSWLLLVVLLAFAADAFLILPLVSTKYCCANCPQKKTCPWMAKVVPENGKKS